MIHGIQALKINLIVSVFMQHLLLIPKSNQIFATQRPSTARLCLELVASIFIHFMGKTSGSQGVAPFQHNQIEQLGLSMAAHWGHFCRAALGETERAVWPGPDSYIQNGQFMWKSCHFLNPTGQTPNLKTCGCLKLTLKRWIRTCQTSTNPTTTYIIYN